MAFQRKLLALMALCEFHNKGVMFLRSTFDISLYTCRNLVSLSVETCVVAASQGIQVEKFINVRVI